MQYQYRCFPVPTTIDIGKKGGHEAAVQQYQDIINKGAENGWEYVGIDVVTSRKPTGCMNTQTIETSYKIIIFKKGVE